ncbi:MAG TPA: FAD-binding protein [Methanocella sp.]|jgi:glycerol-3-phosphate dehydrogenase subunit B
MTMDILRLECDNLVIGSGLAGLSAALRLPGKTVIATAGLGATAISGGVLALPQERDIAAEQWLLDTLRSTGCPYREGHCMTDALVVRHGLVQESMDYEGTPALVALDGRPAGSMVAVDVKLFAGRSIQEIAHLIEADDAALDALGSALSDAGGESYLLPPVLGISRAVEARRRLESMTGARICEYVAAPSVLGLRLVRALQSVVDRNKAITVLETTRIESVNDRACGLTGTKGKRVVSIEAGNIIIATGGPLTGFRVDGDRLYEPLTGITVADLEADVSHTFIADHPLMFKGIGVRPTGAGHENLRAAGAAAVGFGLYEALRTGYHAGDGL